MGREPFCALAEQASLTSNRRGPGHPQDARAALCSPHRLHGTAPHVRPPASLCLFPCVCFAPRTITSQEPSSLSCPWCLSSLSSPLHILTLLSPVRLIFLSPFLFLGPLSPSPSLASSDETVEEFSDEWIDIYILDRFVQELEAQDADEGYLQASRAGVLPLVLAVARGQMSAEEANAAIASVA